MQYFQMIMMGAELYYTRIHGVVPLPPLAGDIIIIEMNLEF